MPSFQNFFPNQPGAKSQKPSFPNESLSLSVVLQYAETAKKQSLEAFCRTQPLVKAYREKVEGTLEAIVQTGSKLEEESEVPAAYAAGLSKVKETFKVHLAALDEWIRAFSQKNASQAEKAMAETQQSGRQLEAALQSLSERP